MTSSHKLMTSRFLVKTRFFPFCSGVYYQFEVLPIRNSKYSAHFDIERLFNNVMTYINQWHHLVSSYMDNISLFMSQQFRTIVVVCFCIYCSYIIRKKLKSDIKRHIFQNMTSLVTTLLRDFIETKTCCFHNKGKEKKKKKKQLRYYVMSHI